MTVTPSEIRAATIDHTRRGYDPAQVHSLLALAADAIEAMQSELESTNALLRESRASEDSLRNTMLAMSQAREEILDTAHSEADVIAAQAHREATRTVARAEDEAAGIVMNGRRQALDVIAEARRDADHLLDTAHGAVVPLTEKVEQLRAVVRRTENLMRGFASGALGELAQAHLMLDEAPNGSAPAMQIVFDGEQYEDRYDHHEDGTVSPLPAAVDRLLSHLSEIG